MEVTSRLGGQVMRRRFGIVEIILIQALVMGWGWGQASAGTIWEWTHDAQGEGTARVYDGGPPVTATGRTTFPDDDYMQFLARDDTRPGTPGGSFGVSGRSLVVPEDESFWYYFGFSSYYSADSRPTSDRPGGEGGGWMTSVVAFVAPVDELLWITNLDVRDTSGFSGTLDVLVENLTKSQTIGRITGDAVFGQNLVLDAGDVVRITTEFNGSGAIPPGVWGEFAYHVGAYMRFDVPEPSTVLLLGIASLAVGGRRKGVRMV